MAKHRDIDRASALMSGTSWHIINGNNRNNGNNRGKGNKSKHKYRCKYYIKDGNKCSLNKRTSVCVGAGECAFYVECD